MVISTTRTGQSGPLHPSSRKGLASLLALALSTGMVSTTVLVPTVAFAFEVQSPISAPQNVVAQLTNTGGISTFWETPASTGNETVSYRAELLQDDVLFETIPEVAPGDTYATFVATLLDGASYSVRITASSTNFPAGTAAGSNSIVAPTAGEGAPSVPLNVVQTVDEVARRVTLTWDTPASKGNAPLYYYSVELLADGVPVQYSQGNANMGNSHTFYRPLAEGKTYTASVFVYNANFASSPVAVSSPGYLAPAPSTPSAPQNVSATVRTAADGSRYMSARWSAPATSGNSAVTGYQAILLEDGVGITGAGGSITSPTEFSSYPLKNGRTYAVSVYAYNANQVAGPAPVSGPFSTAKAAPTVPVNVTAAQTGGDSTTGIVRVSWDAPADNGGDLPEYTVRLTDTDEQVRTLVTTDLMSSFIGLPIDGYTYSVQAVTATGSSPVASGAAPIEVTETLVAPSFTTEPTSYQAATEDAAVTLTTVVAGMPAPTVQWQVSTTNEEGSFTDVVGATSPAYTFTASLDLPTAYYRAVATNSSSAVPSSIAVVQVSAAPLSAPRNLASTPGADADTGKLRFDWDAPLRNGGAPIVRYDLAIDGVHQATSGLATSYLLDPETLTFARGYGSHTLTVTAVNDAGSQTVTTLAYALTRVGKPTLARFAAAPVLDIELGTIAVSWLAPENDGGSPVTGYDLILESQLGGLPDLTVAVTDPTTLTHTFTGIVPNNYDFAVRATNANGTTADAVVNENIVYRDAPSAPQNVVYTQTSNSQVEITFDAPLTPGSDPITGYGTVTRLAGGVVSWNNNGNVRKLTINGLSVGQTYDLGVLARNTNALVGVQQGPLSSQAFTMVQKFAPSAPLNLRAAPDAAGNLVVNYDAPITDGGVPVLQYILRINGGRDARVLYGAGPGTFTIPAVPSGELALTLTATNSVGVSPIAALTYAYTRTGPPTEVEDVQRTQDGQGGLTLVWTAPLDLGGAPIDRYEITLTERNNEDSRLASSRSLAGVFGSASVVLATTQPGVQVFTVAGDVTTLTIPGLANGTSYDVAVRAVNANGSSSAGSTSVRIELTPSVLRNFTATQTGEGVVTLTWAAPSFDGGAPIAGYELSYDDYDFYEETSAGVVQVVFTGVSPGHHTFSGYAYTGDYDTFSPEVTTELTVVSPYVAPVVPAPESAPTAPVVPESAPTLETGFVPASPARLLDTRTGTDPAAATGRVTLTLADLPAGTRSVLLNVTATGARTAGHVTAYAAGTAKPRTSNLNFAPGQTQANLVAVPVGTDGRIVLDVTGTTELVADLVGTYGVGDGFVAVDGDRRLDTRNGPNSLRAGSVTVTLGDSVPADATHVLLNVTATDAEGPGHVTTGAGGSSLNYTGGITQANLVPIKIGADRTVTLTTVGAAAQLVADVQGYWVGSLVGEPSRLLDTRTGGGPVRSTTITLPSVPAGATSVLLNLTVTDTTTDGYAIAYPSGTTRPSTSSLNWQAGQTQANLVILPVLPNGKVIVRIAGDSTANVIADLVGFQQ